MRRSRQQRRARAEGHFNDAASAATAKGHFADQTGRRRDEVRFYLSLPKVALRAWQTDRPARRPRRNRRWWRP